MPVGKPQKESKAQKAAKALRAGKRVHERGAIHHSRSERKTIAQQQEDHRRGRL